MKERLHAIILWLAVFVVIAAIPGALVDTYENGRIYLFSPEFFEDLPARFTGRGRLRFLFQPTVAILLGIGSGIADARAGLAPFVFGLLFDSKRRPGMLRQGLWQVRGLLAIGIILDIIFQMGLYGEVHPGPALLIGPIFVSIPYALARALANRLARRWIRSPRQGGSATTNPR